MSNRRTQATAGGVLVDVLMLPQQGSVEAARQLLSSAREHSPRPRFRLAEVDDGTDYQLGVSNPDTADPLLTRTEVTLQASSVDTLFMPANGGTVSGTLRKDR